MAKTRLHTIELQARPTDLAHVKDRQSGYVIRNEWEVVVEEQNRKAPSLRPAVFLGATTLTLGVGGFLLWSFTTSIAAASIATGQVVVDGQVKKVSLFEGGILNRLLVREGDKVEAGQIIATLDTTRTKAELLQLEHQAVALEVKQARLTAEREGSLSFQYSPDKSSRFLDPTIINSILDGEEKVFTERRRYQTEGVSMERSLAEQLESQRHALEARLFSYQEQISIIETDKKSLETLFRKRLTTKTELSAKQLAHMEIQSKVLETQAALIEATQKVSQAKISIMNRETEFKREVVQTLQETQIALAQTRQKIIAARDVVEKSNIRSPQDGIVANIDSDSRTSGSAIAAGRQILEIVPADEQLIVEGRLPIRNINDAKIGADVQITLSNSDTYKHDPLFGTLTYIGADSITDEKSGDTYFPIHVRIEKDEVERQPEVLISPGIRAELLITSADRLAISYLTQPIRDSFRRAFRED